jgi:predicted GNAT family acetyltransferase
MKDVDWLKSMLAIEREVRPPSSTRREQKYLDGNCVKLYHDGKIVAYAEMRKVGKHTEISTVLVDPSQRNKGVGKELILKAVESIENDKILCCTKNPAMAKVLQNLDFKSIGWPGLSTATMLTFNTFARLFSMLIRFEFRRIWQQGKGIHKYERYELTK